MRASTGPRWRPLAEGQAGVVSRGQLLALGMTAAQARQRVDTGHWRAVHPGIYATFTGPLPDLSRIWAAVLYAGPGAAAAGRTALFLHAVVDVLPIRIEVAVPHERRVVPRPRVDVIRVRALGDRVRHGGSPARLQVEHAVLDVVAAATTAREGLDVVLRSIQRGRTTPDRLRATLHDRSRQRRRLLVTDLLDDAADGVRSALERRFLIDVIRAHSLPRGSHNTAVEERDGWGRATGRRYRDVRFPQWRLLVELDGREAHPGYDRWRDRRRDNRAMVAGEVSLRYGWAEVTTTPCEVAAELAAVLQRHGWRGAPSPCGPACGFAGGTERLRLDRGNPVGSAPPEPPQSARPPAARDF